MKKRAFNLYFGGPFCDGTMVEHSIEKLLSSWMLSRRGIPPGSLYIVGVSLPGLEDTVLQSSGIGEGHVPWVGALVHGIQVESGLQLRLAARQEHDAYKQHLPLHTQSQQCDFERVREATLKDPLFRVCRRGRAH